MLRALVLATLFLVVPRADSIQALRVLHIKIVLVDAEGRATPIPHYLLLVSDNPATALPRRVVTALDGTADVSLRPGNYTVESDRPVAFQGKAYQWTQIVDIVAGRDSVLELTADNAEVETPTPATASAALLKADPSSLLALWQDSVVAIWTPTTHASGFVIDAKGLIATNQRAIGTAASVEVQLTPAVKVAARVVAADAVRDVAVLAIDPTVLASVRPVPLACAQPGKPVAEGQELFTIGAPLRGLKGTASGTVSRVEPRAIVSDLIVATGSAGGPVFNTGGDLIGITTLGDDRDEGSRRRTRIARIDDACGVIASAESKIKDAPRPDGAHLPVEPQLPFPAEALKDAAKRRAGSLSPYRMSAADFDVHFITPILIYGAQYQAEQVSGRERGTRKLVEPALVRPLMDFSNWSEYMADYPPVLVIRVTPKLVESFWTTVARGAARTQGVALPPIKHFKSGFSRMEAFCGDAEVTPIHPFKLEQRLSEKDAIYEGLYVFDPGALGPRCGTVKLVLYSEKEPEKADTRVVDPKLVEQVWQDFAPYRP
jgi:S1-C subfamily serine protease